MIKKVYKILDMHCSNCAMMIESIEDELPGIVRVKASYQKGRMEVEYDETKVTETQILSAVKQKGYEAVSGNS